MDVNMEEKRKWRKSRKERKRMGLQDIRDAENTGGPRDHKETFESRLLPVSIAWAILTAILLLILLWPSAARAQGITKNLAVDAIIGEAEGESQTGKLAIACAIRNRGTLRGVYGVNAPRVKNRLYSSKTFVAAVRAWEESANQDACTFIDGATGWGTYADIQVFEREGWWSRVIVTKKVGAHTFYKEARR